MARGCNHTERVQGCHLCELYFTREDYRRAMDALPNVPLPARVMTPTQAPPADAPALPGFRQKVRNFRSAYQRWRDAGKPVTPPDELARRRAACDLCPHRDPERDACTRCGCQLQEVGLLVSLLTGAPGKLEMATEECPLPEPEKRWRALV